MVEGGRRSVVKHSSGLGGCEGNVCEDVGFGDRGWATMLFLLASADEGFWPLFY